MKSRIVVLRRWQLAAIALGFVVVAATTWAWERGGEAVTADAMPVGERVIHMVTGEYSTTTKDGQEIEAYRWDPGTVFVNKGENVKLKILGVNGDHHPFLIEGLNIQGVVKKGEETVVSFHASKEGIYRLICLTHPDAGNHGPMIGYIVVD
ncbi:cupredoxin domain-containing protein [Paenibacillus sp.]|uniref:cupredoxin domain-containing protein n=1 Tax=Paenibacillus sp. TaxID=58172 RepID=UPI002D5871BC|nr:cupredoxin domain-containing protein [Paenibacillus sp.]HZG58210.1 cupredoxin domain-containing protein [Paenibacillus sp.]